MSTERRYKCNVCSDRIENDTTGIGLCFVSGNAIERKSIHSTEHHLCMNCLAALHKIANEMAMKRTHGSD